MFDEIYHHGIKGMKWGVRKDKGYTTSVRSNGDFVINKGSNIHRITENKNENEKHEGYTYASFTQKDVKHYQRSVTSWIAENNRDYQNTKTFDMTMKVTKDLVAPSEKKKVDTFIRMLDNKDFIKEVNNVYSINISDDDHKSHRLSTLSNKLQKGGMNKDLATFYSAFCMGLNYSPKLRKGYFDKLSKEGYNMITDTEDSYLEAQAPIIVFNRGDTLKVLKISPLPKKYSEEWKALYTKENLSEDPKWKKQLSKNY